MPQHGIGTTGAVLQYICYNIVNFAIFMEFP